MDYFSSHVLLAGDLIGEARLHELLAQLANLLVDRRLVDALVLQLLAALVALEFDATENRGTQNSYDSSIK